MRNIKLRCNNCSKTFNKEYKNIILSSDPLKKRLLDNTFYEAICPHCTAINVINPPIIYIDIERKFMILTDPKLIYEKNKIDFNEAISALDALDKKEFDDFIIRMVTDFDHLKEKIAIFENKMSDRAIELLKCVLLGSENFQIKNDSTLKNVFYEKIGGEDKLIFIKEDGNFRMDFPKELYDQIMNNYSRYFEEISAHLVDLNWAYEFLSKI
ncbi:MAG: CpXC domain-containing protein [Tissierellia bacterium]|nr:CpXC domain-containing protein [Tissierellia bacterium]